MFVGNPNQRLHFDRFIGSNAFRLTNCMGAEFFFFRKIAIQIHDTYDEFTFFIPKTRWSVISSFFLFHFSFQLTVFMPNFSSSGSVFHLEFAE